MQTEGEGGGAVREREEKGERGERVGEGKGERHG